MQQSNPVFRRKGGRHICHGTDQSPYQNRIEQSKPQVRRPAFLSSLSKNTARGEKFPGYHYGKDREKGPKANPHFHNEYSPIGYL